MPLSLFSGSKAKFPINNLSLHHEWRTGKWYCASVGGCWEDIAGVDRHQEWSALSARVPQYHSGAHPMRVQFAAYGFVVLRQVVGAERIDALASTISEVMRARDECLKPTKGGFAVKGVMRWPERFEQYFQAINGSAKLHLALRHIFGDGQDGYRFMGRNEIVIESAQNWHQDALGNTFTRDIDAWSSHRRDLVNVALYLQDGGELPELEVLAGSHVLPNRNSHRKFGQCTVFSRDGCWSHIGVYPQKGDIVIFDWAVTHRTGGFESRHRAGFGNGADRGFGRPTAHRSLFNIGYGRNNELMDCYARGWNFRDTFSYNPERYGCSSTMTASKLAECKNKVEEREYSALYGEVRHGRRCWTCSAPFFSTGGFILVSDYLRMEVTLVGASWVVSLCVCSLLNKPTVPKRTV